jgi:catechol 2,3-dioxygenase-like lactoylglutathione lyase family enzyme
MDMTVHFHHVHMNVRNRDTSAAFYQKHLHAERIRLNDTTDAIHAAPALLLMDESPAPLSTLPTGLQHVGWGSKDIAAWYDAAHKEGVEPDTRGNTLFNTNDTPTIGGPGSYALMTAFGPPAPACVPTPDAFSYIYVLGPDGERIEVWSGADMRLNHVHFTTADLSGLASWYRMFLGITTNAGLTYFQFYLDDINLFFETIGQASDYKPTDDFVLGHVAFSVADLDAWHMRAQAQKVEIVSGPAEVNGFKSFFVRGPDAVLVELVQAAPLKELCPPAKASQAPAAGVRP